MTDARLAALEAVADATERAIAEWDADGMMQIPPMRSVIAALRALPAQPQPAGEVVEVRAHVWLFPNDQQPFVASTDKDFSPWQKIATLTATVPLPRIPTVEATVVAGGGE